MEFFTEVVLYGWWLGLPGSSITFETHFGWVVAGGTDSCVPAQVVTSHHTAYLTGNVLHHLWEVEEKAGSELCLMLEEKSVLNHFLNNHTQLENGRYMVPLPPGNWMSNPLVNLNPKQYENLSHLNKNQFSKVKAVID